ncbi:DEAD/DEAH box helicase family protein [Cohnella sp. CBP 2801]|uniref:DEAD/DEAH box helicase family protein n=2 Tax=Cohnella zeiphila TaxID=2761120 RepID=A0A7X0VW92_9BACL|nr:DEAD/DEAH box helicase family protein [Cohnella zeiphila]
MKRAIGMAWEAACGAAADEEAQREIRAAQEWPIETERLGRREGRGGAAGEAWVAAEGLEAGKLEAMAKAARQAGECLRGRSLLREEATALLAESSLREEPEALRALQLAALLGAARLRAAVQPAAAGSARRSRALRCRRCGSGEERMRRTRCASCGRSGCAVCEACATLGRSRECGLLALGAAPREQLLLAPPVSAEQQDAAPDAVLDRWGLSPAQRSASTDAVRFLRENAFAAAPARLPETRPVERHNVPSRPGQHFLSPLRKLLTLRAGQPFTFDRSFLLWAVTGAGKTEMIFPLLETVLRAGGRALVATPRRDVVLELAPRLAKAFPNDSMAVLYGGSEDRWRNAGLTLATTHQLFRFQEAFDLVLIDELDAFPYHNDPLLHFAAVKARKPAGATVLLSATPPPALQRAVRRGSQPCARVPVRYHRHPLPVPRRLGMPPMKRWVRKGHLPPALAKAIVRSVERGAQLFLFVPYIKHVAPLVELLRRHADEFGLAPEAIDGTSSVDEARALKVSAFRAAELRILVTTTILERGVTIPRSDVFILEAEQAQFDEAALVQMAGRAGRSADDPHGKVIFCSSYLSQSQRGAIGQITAMNRLARKKGFMLKEATAR